jgi:hypothetical protein
VLFDTTRLQIRVVCSSTRMACFILLVRANSSPPKLKSVLFPTLAGRPPHSAKRDLTSQAIDATSHTVQAVGQWKTKTATQATRNFKLRARAFTYRPQYRNKTRTLAASPQKGATQEQRTSTYHAIRFNFFNEPGLRPLHEKYATPYSHCVSIIYFYWANCNF